MENQKNVKFKFLYSETCDKEVWRDCYYRKQIAILGRPKALTIRKRRDIIRNTVKKPFVSAQNLFDIWSFSEETVTAQTIRNV